MTNLKFGGPSAETSSYMKENGPWTLVLTDYPTLVFDVSFIDMTGRWWWFYNAMAMLVCPMERFGRDIEADFWSRIWGRSLVWILNMNFNQLVIWRKSSQRSLNPPPPLVIRKSCWIFFGKLPNKALFKGLKSGTRIFGLIMICFGSVIRLLTAVTVVNAFNPFGSVMPLAMFKVLSLFWKWDKMILT